MASATRVGRVAWRQSRLITSPNGVGMVALVVPGAYCTRSGCYWLGGGCTPRRSGSRAVRLTPASTTRTSCSSHLVPGVAQAGRVSPGARTGQKGPRVVQICRKGPEINHAGNRDPHDYNVSVHTIRDRKPFETDTGTTGPTPPVIRCRRPARGVLIGALPHP